MSHIDFYRKYREEDFEVEYPSGETYIVGLREAKLLLIGLRVPKDIIERFIDKVWNLYAYRLILSGDYHFETIPTRYRYEGPGELDQYEWLLKDPDDDIF